MVSIAVDHSSITVYSLTLVQAWSHHGTIVGSVTFVVLLLYPYPNPNPVNLKAKNIEYAKKATLDKIAESVVWHQAS